MLSWRSTTSSCRKKSDPGDLPGHKAYFAIQCKMLRSNLSHFGQPMIDPYLCYLCSIRILVRGIPSKLLKARHTTILRRKRRYSTSMSFRHTVHLGISFVSPRKTFAFCNGIGMLTDIGVSFPFSKASSMAFTAASCAKSFPKSFAKSFDPDFNVLKRVAHPHSDSQISQAKIAKRKHLFEESDPGSMFPTGRILSSFLNTKLVPDLVRTHWFVRKLLIYFFFTTWQRFGHVFF